MTKRYFELIFTVLICLFLFPVFLILIIAIRFNLCSPIFFRQVRPGKNGKPFEMIKFRTMICDIDKKGNSLPDSERITPFGKFLRSSSLDELPGFWNVIKGDLSLVGPRPLLMDYLPLYSKQQNRRHEVRPGITGWAQVNGRNALSWDDKFKLDVWYVDNQSFWLDLKILFLTVKKVIVKEGISAKDHVTMPFFTGNENQAMDSKNEK